MQQLFLGRLQARTTTFLVSYITEENSWMVNAGGRQRLPTEGGTEFQLENGMKTVTTQVLANFSKVNLELPPSDAVFSATLKSPISMISNRFRLAISLDSDDQGATYLSNYLQQKVDADLQLTGNEYDTDYVARLYDGELRLTMVNQTQPLFKTVKGYNNYSVEEFLNRSVSVARWRNKLELSNPNVDISDKDIEIQFYDSNGNPVENLIFRQPNSDTEVNIQLSITNRSNKPLCISVVYFGSDFSASNQFLRSKQVKPNENVWVEYENGKNIPLFLPIEYLAWGVNEVEEHFKIFVSEDRLNTDSLNQEGLPLDTRNMGSQRAVQYDLKEFSLSNWRTFERSYRLISPFKGIALDENKEVKYGNIKMIAPNGFSAKVEFTTTVDAKRIDPSVTNQRFGNYLTPVALIEGMANCPIVDVIEIFDFLGTVSKEKPLRIELLIYTKNVVPMGYDREKEAFFPIGSQNTQGVILIEQLPSATNTRFGVSFRIFFRRTITSEAVQ
jgi:hypothetical protein